MESTARIDRAPPALCNTGGSGKMNRIKIKKKAERIVVTHTLKKKELLNNMAINVVNHNEIPPLVPIEIIRGFRLTKLRFFQNNAD
ncbi:MAG: hypothetical protein LUF68_00755, partial [Clostridiales bacterium]|nr:hypothetical protein [Clostridiales bacterium]